MITAISILIILTFAVTFILLVLIKQQQEISHSILYKIQDDMLDEITQIRRTVKGINEKVEQIRRLNLPKK